MPVGHEPVRAVRMVRGLAEAYRGAAPRPVVADKFPERRVRVCLGLVSAVTAFFVVSSCPEIGYN